MNFNIGDRVSTGYLDGTVCALETDDIKVCWVHGLIGTVLYSQLSTFNLSVLPKAKATRFPHTDGRREMV